MKEVNVVKLEHSLQMNIFLSYLAGRLKYIYIQLYYLIYHLHICIYYLIYTQYITYTEHILHIYSHNYVTYTLAYTTNKLTYII